MPVKDKILRLLQGDITMQQVDAIVNAANSSLMGGGGVDGAIHRAGGPAILEDCKKIAAKTGRLPAGEAVITTGGNLPAKHVIHTVGPVWGGGIRNEDALLANCYRNSLRIAAENNCRTVAFPSISTGAYRFPIDRAARIAIGTILDEAGQYDFRQILLVLFSAGDLQAYQKAYDERGGAAPGFVCDSHPRP
jgi:O-acetyl-ADP-ribose deacetylase (regulator of RNase III)